MDAWCKILYFPLDYVHVLVTKENKQYKKDKKNSVFVLEIIYFFLWSLCVGNAIQSMNNSLEILFTFLNDPKYANF